MRAGRVAIGILQPYKNVTRPAITGQICTNYTCLEMVLSSVVADKRFGSYFHIAISYS